MRKSITGIILLLALAVNLIGQETFDKSDIVNRLADLMNRNYVFPEKGKAMHDLIKKKLADGDYEEFSTQQAFVEQLDQDLKSIIYDKHIRVRYDQERFEAIRSGRPAGGRSPQFNYGFQEVKIIDGQIGYLDLRGFADIRFAEDAAKKAMDELINADAIIFDLRQNGGGSPSMVRFLSSYLFGQEPVHLNTFYWRPADRYQELWTDPALASQSKPDIPVYILTSDYTFSAAEGFTYHLQSLERATVIGEVTGGGAHPGGPMIIADGFFVNIPQGRAINPVTKTNWEGVGIIPHIQTSSEEALDKALELARKALLKH